MFEDKFTRVLYIDLSKKSFTIKSRPDLFERWFGGTGVGIQILKEECPKNVDPFSPDNTIIFAVGPITSLYPLASKTVAIFKSPLTGNLGESHAGGRSAVSIMMAGYGAIVIKGKSDIPVYLSILDNEVRFHDARAIWGIKDAITVGKIIRQREPFSGQRSIMRIGRAGENLVSFASLNTETYRHFGRLGLGAVFGSKNLKALVIAGKRTINLPDPKMYLRMYKNILDETTSSLMKKYHDLGTAANVLPLHEIGGLPIENLNRTSYEGAIELSGENLAQNYLGRRIACTGCPVACVHIATFREPHEEEKYFYKTSMIGYDYEPIYSLGTMLGIKDAKGFLKLMDKTEKLGLDAMSSGVALAWATEMLNKNLINERETLVKFSFGEWEGYIEGLENIVSMPNDFYKALARGTSYASKIYGGKDFALNFGKNEMPGYHTGAATHLGWFLGARHSHLDNAGYSMDQSLKGHYPEPEKLVDKLIEEEANRQILSSLVVCFFARAIYLNLDNTINCLKTVNINITKEELKELGMEIYRQKMSYKTQEGWIPSHLDLPKRIYETSTPYGKISEDYMRKAVDYFRNRLEKDFR
ncbi:aldehyde:ferredoxin oxidoreductase [Thermodesulfobium acidiphilum]|uniref:Aldehyde:ferredoxin oxidoreductase n=1 Tax=Thermodesulfobium acidiphilum TaxID=1794699 RepID=A0A2R4W033_THEAF|nr:aldehyde ferredoxin oxidoreductase N-terminal domain-containing protein [Thermodesulfobium acidiphilum]AWB10159.1 aldehyde:ferredoxin oxidoreductase [Thermodesulfobium acidiphilum]